jgi:hypothetical protein
MMEIKIPHAQKTFVERNPPRVILHVVTNLLSSPTASGFDAEAWHEMMQAIGQTLDPTEGYDGYRVHSPDNP